MTDEELNRIEKTIERYEPDLAQAFYDYRAKNARLRLALESLTMWFSRWRHAIVLRAEGATQAWDELEAAHNRGCGALNEDDDGTTKK